MHDVTQKFLAILVAFSLCGQLAAQSGVSTFIKKVGTFIDTMSVKGVDRRYIDIPEDPWQLIVKGNVSQGELSMETKGSIIGYNYEAITHMKTEPSQYVGLWAGYRGYGHLNDWYVNTSVGIRL